MSQNLGNFVTLYIQITSYRKNFYFYYNTLFFTISNFDKKVGWSFKSVQTKNSFLQFRKRASRSIKTLWHTSPSNECGWNIIFSNVWYCDFKSSFSLSSHWGKSSIFLNLGIDHDRSSHFMFDNDGMPVCNDEIVCLISSSHPSILQPMQNVLQRLSMLLKILLE